ncbi:MAG: hypothetical protein IIX14_06685 [Clostridia bacterium]|nr:hypothetical protein [Clostridia bacterium]
MFNTKSFFKKIISLALVAVCLFSITALSGCDAVKKEKAVTLNGVEISNDVFTYFLDLATVELGTDADSKALREMTLAYLTTYFKTNSLAHAHGIELTIGEKAAVSQKVNDRWFVYGAYYQRVGITKETLTKVFTADAYRDRLILAYYGEGGTEEIPVARLYAAFRTNYIIFQAITGYFTETDEAGNSVRLPKNEVESLVLRFQSMADVVNSGEKTMDEAADFLAEAGIQSAVQTVVLHKDDDSYPQGFFQKVQSIDTRYAAIIGTNDYIFLVLRGEADANSKYFNDKKIEIIQSIVGDGIDTIIDGAYEVDSKVAPTVFNSYLQLIKSAKGE